MSQSKSSGPTILGLLLLATAVWLLDSAVKNRSPIATLESIIRNPANARTTTLQSNGTYAPVPASTPGTSTGTSSKSGTALLAEMEKIGTGRKYSENAALRNGPNYYDCSGLVYAAGHNIGLWPAGTTTFNTVSFRTHIRDFGLTNVGGTPQAGDILLWPAKHMGVATDSTHLFAAMSEHDNPQIGISTIAGTSRSELGISPTIYRFPS